MTIASRTTVLVFAATLIFSVEFPFSPFVGVRVTQSASHDALHEILDVTATLLAVLSDVALIASESISKLGTNATCDTDIVAE